MLVAETLMDSVIVILRHPPAQCADPRDELPPEAKLQAQVLLGDAALDEHALLQQQLAVGGGHLDRRTPAAQGLDEQFRALVLQGRRVPEPECAVPARAGPGLGIGRDQEAWFLDRPEAGAIRVRPRRDDQLARAQQPLDVAAQSIVLTVPSLSVPAARPSRVRASRG